MAEDAPFLARWSHRKSAARAAAVSPEAARAAAASEPAVPAPALAPSAVAPAALQADAHAAGATAGEPAAPLAPPPTLADVDALGRDADFARFVARDVAPEVKNAALKKLFADPHFNLMDGLDTYIDDYGRPDPLPPGMLRRLAQSSLLGLFDGEDRAAAAAAAAAAPDAVPGAVPGAAPDAAPDAALDAALDAVPEAAAHAVAQTAPNAVPAPSVRCDASRPAVLPALPQAPLPASPAAHEDAAVQLQPDHAPGRGCPGPGAEADAGGQR